MDKTSATLVLLVIWLPSLFYVYFFSMNDWLQPTADSCLSFNPTLDQFVFSKVGFPFWDIMSCVGSSFFTPISMSASGIFILREMGGLVAATVLLMGMESQRLGASGLMITLLLPVTLFICLEIGYGIFFPLIWIIAYWWRPGSSKQDTRIGGTKAGAVGVVALAVVAGFVALSIPSLKLSETPWLNVIILMPILLAPYVYFSSQGDMAQLGRNVSAKDAANPRVYVHTLVAGASIVLHFWAVADYLATPGGSFLPGILNSSVEWRQEHFFVLDIVLLMLGCMAFILMETGPRSGVAGVLEFVKLGVIFGPGAAFSHSLQAREVYLIMKESEGAAKVE